MSFFSSIKSFAKTVNENKVKIVEAATHIGVAGYVIHDALKNPDKDSVNTCLVWVAGGVVGAAHRFVSTPGGLVHSDLEGDLYFEESTRTEKVPLAAWRGATSAVLAYKLAEAASEYLYVTTEVIGDVAIEAVDMIA